MASRERVIGVALGAGRLVAVEAPARRGAPAVTSRALEPPGDDGSWPSLAQALRALRGAPGGRGGALAVAFLPPVAQVSTLELPPLGTAELEQLVARGPARYFLSAREPQVIGVAARAGGGHAPSAVVGAVPARLLQSIEDAAGAGGLALRTVVAAETAWVAAAAALWPETRRGTGTLLVPRGDRVELLTVRNGALAGVRRFRALDADAVALREALVHRDAPPVLYVLGPTAAAAQVRELSGVPARQPPAHYAELAQDPDALAAAFAWRGAALQFVSARERAARRARGRRAAALVVAAAAALVLVAAALQPIALSRDLGRVEAERAALRGQVAEFVATQDFVSAVGRQITELNDVVAGTPRWSRVLVSLSRHLPPSAYLTALRGQADSLVVEGFATSATGVFQALSRDSLLVDVHSAAPVRSSFLETGEPRDHFTIAGHVAGARPTPLAAPPRRAP